MFCKEWHVSSLKYIPCVHMDLKSYRYNRLALKYLLLSGGKITSYYSCGVCIFKWCITNSALPCLNLWNNVPCSIFVTLKKFVSHHLPNSISC